MPLYSAQTDKNPPIQNIPRRAIRYTVLHLVPNLEINASAREVIDLAVQTHRQGWRPIVASAGGALVLEAERAAVRHNSIPLNKNNLFAKWRSRVQLEALFQRERPAIIHAHGIEVLSLAYSLSLLRRVPLLADIKQPLSFAKSQRKLLHAAALRHAFFRVPSKFMEKHLIEDQELDTDLIYQISPGVDLQWFDAMRVSPERLQKLEELWRLPEQATIIIMATPFTRGGGHKQLFEALARIKRSDVFTVLVNNDWPYDSRKEIEQLVSAFGLEGRVVMPENCTDWPAACWLATIVVAVNTSPRGQAIELIHAQAMGRPAIVTDCGSNTEMVKGGETAWVISPDNTEQLVQALEEAINMTESQRIDLAVRARTFAVEKFPQEIWRSAIIELYEAMLGRHALTAV